MRPTISQYVRRLGKGRGGMDDANIGYQEKRDIWTDYNHRQEFEHQLIDRKTTWWLTSQTILIAAYGLSLQERADSFRQVVAGAGIAIATVSLIGLLGLIYSKWRSWRDYNDFYGWDGRWLPRPLHRRKLEWGVRTKNTWITLLPDVGITVIFIVAWLNLI